MQERTLRPGSSSTMTPEEDYLIDYTNKSLLKKLQQTQTPSECGKEVKWYTEKDNLFLSLELNAWQNMVTDVEIGDFKRGGAIT